MPKIVSADVLFPPASAIIALIARLLKYYLIAARGTSGDRPIHPRHLLRRFSRFFIYRDTVVDFAFPSKLNYRYRNERRYHATLRNQTRGEHNGERKRES